MMYIVVLVALILLIAYVTWRWLARELRDALAGLRVTIRTRRGGRSQAMLIDDTRSAFQARQLEPDCIIVSHEALDLYDALRSQVIDRADHPALPAAVILVLAVDVDARTLFIRAINTPVGRPGRETAEFHDLDQVVSAHTLAHEGPADLVPGADQALELALEHADPQRSASPWNLPGACRSMIWSVGFGKCCSTHAHPGAGRWSSASVRRAGFRFTLPKRWARVPRLS